ncbi:hypothetical protein RCL_jg11086.t1 [Rhizophagus clarus]|uniref:Uncharacterized protein n=1 Tax=Rhizophagus clarus TaxID=94130 RepID=A0A8H3MCI9_9GLOM|nr:hypothetical protein RCL_jg11086.t1 [Rhizophagus clarus]
MNAIFRCVLEVFKNIAFYIWVRDILRQLNKKYYTFIITVNLFAIKLYQSWLILFIFKVQNILLFKLNE